MTSIRLALVLLLFVAPAAASAVRAPLCDEGTFIVQGEPLRERAGLVPPDTVSIEDGRVAIASAGSAKAKLKAKTEGTRVRARIGGPKRAPEGGTNGRWQAQAFENELAAWSWNVLMGLVGFSMPNRPFPSGSGSSSSSPPPLRLKAWISPDCQVMTGELRGGRERMRREFVALAPGAPPDAACLHVWFPVCGDDGETYSNECYAAAAGVGVAHEGPCEPDGAECGTLLGIPCGAGEFCEMPDDTCSSADLGGTCVVIPEVCTQQYDPVCGCDAVTYPNDCERRAALVNKAHDGSCPQ